MEIGLPKRSFNGYGVHKKSAQLNYRSHDFQGPGDQQQKGGQFDMDLSNSEIN